METVTGIGTVRFHWLTLRAAVKLEKAGMKRSKGPSARSMACKEFLLVRNSNYDTVLNAIAKKLGDHT